MAATVSVGTGFWSSLTGADSASSAWRFSTPGPTVNIVWEDGPANINGTPFPATVPFPTEMKFYAPGTPPTGPAAKTFIGFTKVRALAGTSVTTSGAGTSALVGGTLFGSNWVANWTVSASGILVVLPVAGSYEATASGHDPMPLTKDDFDRMNLIDNRFHLYLPVTLQSLSNTHEGTGGLKVSYKTASGTAVLLDLTADFNTVSVGGDEPDFLRIYRQRSLDENPMALAERPWALKELRDAIAQLSQGGSLTKPFGFGFLLKDLPRPTTEIEAGGVVAELHVDSSVSVAEAAGDDSRRQYQPTQG